MKKAAKFAAGVLLGGALLSAHVSSNLERKRIRFDENPARFRPFHRGDINAFMKVLSGRNPDVRWDDDV